MQLKVLKVKLQLQQLYNNLVARANLFMKLVLRILDTFELSNLIRNLLQKG